MRIKENIDGYRACPPDLQNRIVEVFQYASQITETRKLLAAIKEDSGRLRELFLTENEAKEKKDATDFFDARMQSLVYYTAENLKGYQQGGWKELLYEEDDSDGVGPAL